MIGLTLINNMKVLARNWTDVSNTWVKVSFPMIAMFPAMVVSLFTEDVASIVSYVGSYAGGLIQYVFPSLLVYYSRNLVQQRYFPDYVASKSPSVDLTNVNFETEYFRLNKHASFFKSKNWLYITAVWWVLSLILVTSDHILDAFKK